MSGSVRVFSGGDIASRAGVGSGFGGSDELIVGYGRVVVASFEE
jgi:hypothetical protein